MSAHGNKAAFRPFVDEAANKGNLAVIDGIFAPHVVYHLGGGGDIHGHEGVKGLVRALRVAFPDLHVRIEELVGEGDTIVARVCPSGTNTGVFMGNAPTGKRAAWTVVHMGHFSEGKIVEHWAVTDQMSLLRQLGLAPAAER